MEGQAEMAENRIVLMTDYFLVPDGEGTMRRIYRTGCPRCGKPSVQGTEFCDGHRYMTGNADAVLRGRLEEAVARKPGLLEKLSGILLKRVN